VTGPPNCRHISAAPEPRNHAFLKGTTSAGPARPDLANQKKSKPRSRPMAQAKPPKSEAKPPDPKPSSPKGAAPKPAQVFDDFASI
jgi:hypothetical protein